MLLDKQLFEIAAADMLLFEITVLYAAGAKIGDRMIRLERCIGPDKMRRLKPLLERADDLIYDNGLPAISLAERVNARRTGRDDRLAPESAAGLTDTELADLWREVEGDLELMGIAYASTCRICDPLDNRPVLE